MLNGILLLIFGFFSTTFFNSDSTSAPATQNALNSTTFTEVPAIAEQPVEDTDKKVIMTNKITEMYNRYKQYRTESASVYMSQGWTKGEAVENQELMAADAVNLREAEALVDHYRLPTISKVGAENAHKFWLMVMQFNHDTEFQTRILKAMHEELEENDVSTADYAFLTDRIRVNQGRAQLYGTQVFYNEMTEQFEPFDLKKPDSVDQRRVIMGLERINSYIKEVNSKFSKPAKRKSKVLRSDRTRG